MFRTSDGYALALGWEHGWAVWTVYGRLTAWAVGGDAGGAEGGEQSPGFQDRFMNGIKELVSKHTAQGRKFSDSLLQFWGPGNFELFAMCEPPSAPVERGMAMYQFADTT